MALIDTLKKIGRAILPEPIEKLLGIQQSPVMDFSWGEGLTETQRQKADEILAKPSGVEPIEIGLFGTQKYLTRPADDLLAKGIKFLFPRITETKYQRIAETKSILKDKGLDDQTAEKIALAKEVVNKSIFFQLASSKSPEEYKKLTPEMREDLFSLDMRRATEGMLEILPLPIGKIKPVGKLAGEVIEEGIEKLPKYAININLNKLKTTGEVKNVINNVSKMFEGSINEARRGIITHQATEELADNLGLSVKKLLKNTKGVIKNAETLLASRKILNSSAEEVYILSKKVIETGATKDLVNFRLALDQHKQIQEVVSGLTAETGRALSSLNIPAGAVETKTKFLNEALDRLGGRDLTEKMAQKLAQIDPADTLSMNKFLRDITKVKVSDKVYEVWINSILSSPSTHQVNSLSNLLVKLSTIPEKTLATMFDFGFSKAANRPQQRFFGEVGADIVGMYKGLTEGARRGLFAFMNEMPVEAATKLEIGGKKAIPGVVGKIVRIPGRFLVAADEFFKGINYTSELYSLAYRQTKQEGIKGLDNAVKRIAEIVAEPSEKLVSKATKEMLYRTFTQDTGAIGKVMMSVRQKVPFMRYVVPFLRTPINIAKFGLERTPLNFLRIGAKALKQETALKGTELTSELAKATMGSILSLATYLMVKEGKITGGGSRDKATRDALYRQGWQPYSIKIGDKYYSYQRLEPLSTIVGFTADAVEILEGLNQTNQNDLISRIALSFSQNLMNKTFLKGLSDITNAISDPVRYGASWIEGLAGSVVPNAVSWLARATDPYFRKPDNLLETIKSKIPELSKEVIPSRGVFGQPAERGGTTAWQLLTPIYVSKIKQDPVEAELKRLNLTINFPGKTISNLNLTAKQYDQFLKATGKVSKNMVAALIQSPQYQTLSDWDKQKLIEDTISDLRSEIRKEFLPEIVKDNLDIELPEYINNTTFSQLISQLYGVPEFKNAKPEQQREILLNLIDKVLTR